MNRSEHQLRVGRIRNHVAQHLDELTGFIGEARKGPTCEIITSELYPFLSACRFLEKRGCSLLNARKLGRNGRPWWMAAHHTTIVRQPLGRIMILNPSNYPFLLAGVQTLQALFAGNSVVLKPSPGSEPLWHFFQSLVIKSGFPEDSFIVTGSDKFEVLDWFKKGIQKLIMTGGYENGIEVYKLAAGFGVPCTMELSGCDAMVAGPSADKQTVIDALKFGLKLNAGKSCIAPRRLLVPEREIEEYARLLKSGNWGFDSDEKVNVGESASAHFAEKAEADGGEILVGRNDRGDWSWPIILKSCPATMRRNDLDIFEPLLTLETYTSDQDLIDTINDSRFGLSCSLFDKNPEWAERLVPQISTGHVTVNDLIACTADPRIPFGGVKASGFGVTRGEEGLLEMTRPKVIQVSAHKRHRHFQSPPKGFDSILTDLAMLLNQSGMSAKFKILTQFIKHQKNLKNKQTNDNTTR